MSPVIRKSKPSFAPRDALTDLIQAAIPSLEAIDAIDQPEPGRLAFDGYCARSAAAYQYLCEHEPRVRELAVAGDVRMRRAKPDGHADSHYWLETADGQIVELNAGPEDRPDRSPYPYHLGKGGSVLKDRTDPTLPARKDAQRIIAVVRGTLDAVDAVGRR